MKNFLLVVMGILLSIPSIAEKRIYFIYGWERQEKLPSIEGEVVDHRLGGGNYFENWGRNDFVKGVATPYREGGTYVQMDLKNQEENKTFAGVFVNGKQSISFAGVNKDWYLHFALNTDHEGTFNLLFYENWKWGAQKTFDFTKYIPKTDKTWVEVNIPVKDMIDAGLEILTWNMNYDANYDSYLYYLGYEGKFDKGIKSTQANIDDMYFTSDTPGAAGVNPVESEIVWSLSSDIITCNNGKNKGIDIISLTGIVLLTSSDNQINIQSLQPGCYIAKSGTDTYKFKK